MVYEIPVDHTPDGVFLENEDRAKAWVLHLIAGVKAARKACDIVYPNDVVTTVREQQRAERTWLLRHGGALGAISALYRCRLLSEVAYQEFRKQIMDTMIPTIIGSAG